LGGLVERPVRATQDRRASRRRLDETEEDAERRRLAGAVRAEKTGDATSLDREAQIVDGDRLSEPLRQSVDLDDSQREPPSARRCYDIVRLG
jgi:hypothetical protein